MRADTLQLLSELKSAELFRNIGHPSDLPHRSVASWSEALASCCSESWTALQLMTNNRRAGRVNELNWDRFQQWNPTCASLRPEVLRITEDAVERVGRTREITRDFRNSVSSDLLGILLEREFEDVVAPLFCLPVLHPIYCAGHFPCGWTGPELDTYWSAGRDPIPNGEILIY